MPTEPSTCCVAWKYRCSVSTNTPSLSQRMALNIGFDFRTDADGQLIQWTAQVSDRRRRIDAGPEVHRAQLFTAAGLEIQEQLCAVGRTPTEDKVHHHGPARRLLAVESVDFTTKIGIGHICQQRRIGVALRGNRL